MKKKDENGVGVTHVIGLCLLLVITTQRNMYTDHVDISQAFTQGELLDGDGQNGKVYISSPPDYVEGNEYCYLLK